MRQFVLRFLILAVIVSTGCATTRNTDTPRTGLEQLLISNAVDRALKKIDFEPLRGSSVYLEEKYVDGVDKNYVIASIRHSVLKSGVKLVTKADDADVIIEARSGGVGTDRVDTFIGSPELSVPGPFAVALPEVKLLSRTTQIGTAKIGIVAYDAKTREVVGQGGVSLSRSNDHKWYVLGAGPFNSGTIREEVVGATGQSVVPLPVIESISLSPWEPKKVAPVSFNESGAVEKPGELKAPTDAKSALMEIIAPEDTPTEFIDDGWAAPENFPSEDVVPQNTDAKDDPPKLAPDSPPAA